MTPTIQDGSLLDEVFSLTKESYESITGEIDLSILPEESPDVLRQIKLEELMLREAGKVTLSKYGDPTVSKTFLGATSDLRDARLKGVREQFVARLESLKTESKQAELRNVLIKLTEYLDSDTIALIAYDAVAAGVQVLSNVNLTETSIVKNIARELEVEALVRKANAVDPLLFRVLVQKALQNPKNKRWKKLSLLIETADDFIDFNWEWLTESQKVKLGHFLKEVVFEGTGLFESLYVPIFGKNKLTYKVHIILTQAGEEAREEFIQKQVAAAGQHWPMIIPPKDWVINEAGDVKYVGGYYKASFGRTSLLIHGDSGTKVSQLAVDALNNLQRIAWKINPFIYGVLKGMQGRLVDIGSFRTFDLTLVKASQEVINPGYLELSWNDPDLSEDDVRKRNYTYYLQKKHKADEDRLKAISQNPNRVMELATLFLPVERFYSPWYMDNRSRMYPICDTLSPQGGDFQKALLQFADGSPKGPEARCELLESIATSYGNGFDKKPFEARKEAGLVLVDLMKNCVRNPNTPEAMAIWCEADEPFQFLAMVHEYYKVYVWEIQDEHYVACGRDATSSGIQLAGALLRDTKTCKLVNVLYTPPAEGEPTPPPQDAYGAVAAEAKKLLSGKVVIKEHAGESVKVDWLEYQVERIEARKVKANEAAKRKYERDKEKLGNATPEPVIKEPRTLADYKATLPISSITRSVAKMPVMLRPYGGTFATIYSHVREKLDSILNPKDEYGRAKNSTHQALLSEDVTLITHALLDGMEVALPAFTTLNEWFRETAGVITKFHAQDKSKEEDNVLAKVKWHTPSGCTIVQEYWEKIIKNTKCALGNTTRTRSYSQQDIGFNKTESVRKMQTAFAANVIHSLDASVIQLAAHEYKGSPFTAVHDCIYGPAGTLSILTQKIREAFVEVVKNKGFLDDIRRSNDLPDEYQSMIPPSPPTGRANIELALESPYLFS